MNIQFFNFWYFFWLVICIGSVVGLYFILRNRSEKTKKIVLSCILFFGLALHFLKCFIPPYSTDLSRLYRDIWFVNICGANILLFPFMFFSKNKTIKDYMFCVGVLSGILSIILPLEPIQKANQAGEILDIIRFYFHHTMLWAVPLLMVLFKLHKPNYKNCWKVPAVLLVVMLFIMLNQIFQSEIGFIPLRDNNFFDINFKNTSYIWAPGNDAIGKILSFMCPEFFKTVPVGEFAGQTKYWPWFWLIIPGFVYLTPLSFLLILIFDFKHFKNDLYFAIDKLNVVYSNITLKIKEKNAKKQQPKLNNLRVSARAVIIVDGKVLTMFRRKIKDGNVKEYYVVPGGGQENGETLQQNVLRELKEEMNIDIKILGYLGKQITSNTEEHFFHCEITNGTPVLSGEEKDRMTPENYYEPMFVEIDNLKNLNFDKHEFVRKAIDKNYTEL